MRRIVLAVLVFALTASNFGVQANSAEEIKFIPITASWLETLNYYRTSSGLSPVTEDPKFSEDVKSHTDYLAKTDASFFTGSYQNRHTENPASPFYKGRGLFSNLASSRDPNQSLFIDQWIQAPFHAIGMLREGLKSAGMGVSLDERSGYFEAGLDIGQGLKNVGRSKDILYPGDGAYSRLNRFMGESPDPRESCGSDWEKYRGLPVFVSLVANPPQKMSATITQPSGKEFSSGNDLCIVNEHTFVTSNKIYGPAGKSIIDAENMVLLIAKEPLEAGINRVSLKMDGRPDKNWSFTVIPEPKEVSFSYSATDLMVTWKPGTVAAPNQITGYQVSFSDENWKNSKLFTTDKLEFDASFLPDGKYLYCVTAIGKYRSGDCTGFYSVKISHEISKNPVVVYYPYTVKGNSRLILPKSKVTITFDTSKNTSASTSTPQICTTKVMNGQVIVYANKVGICSVDIKDPGAKTMEAVDLHYDFPVITLSRATCKKGSKTLITSGYPATCPSGYKKTA